MTGYRIYRPIDETDQDPDEAETYVWDSDPGEYVPTADLAVTPPGVELFVLVEGVMGDDAD